MKQRVLPGFGLSLGTTLVYLSLLVLLPLSALAFKASTLSVEQFWSIATGERALAAYRVTFGASLLAALINAVFGLIVAWVLVRYPFPGKRFVDSLVDLPFALPTAVAGITLATLYAGNGWIGPDDPELADPEWGGQMMDGVAAYLVDFIGAFGRAPLPAPMPVRTTKAYGEAGNK